MDIRSRKNTYIIYLCPLDFTQRALNRPEAIQSPEKHNHGWEREVNEAESEDVQLSWIHYGRDFQSPWSHVGVLVGRSWVCQSGQTAARQPLFLKGIGAGKKKIICCTVCKVEHAFQILSKTAA